MSVPSEGSAPRRATAIVAFALVVTLAAATFAVLGVVKLVRNSGSSSSGGGGSISAQATTAMTEGGQLAVDFTSFNYETLDSDFTHTAAHATPAFAKTYLTQSRAVESLLKKAKAVATSQVIATGLKSYDASAGTATVIAALNVTTKNSRQTGPCSISGCRSIWSTRTASGWRAR